MRSPGNRIPGNRPGGSAFRRWAAIFICLGPAAAALGQSTPGLAWSARVSDQALASLAVSPDGSTAAAGCGDGTVQFRRVSDGALVRSLAVPEPAASVEFSPDGTLLATCGTSSGSAWLRLWRVSDGTLVRSIRTVYPASGNRLPLAFTPDGSHAAATLGGTNVGLWRVSDGALARTLRGSRGGVINSIAFSPDGARVAVASGIRGTDVGAHLVRVADGALERSIVPENNNYGVAQAVFSPDSTQVALRPFWYSSFQGSVELRRVSDGGLIRSFPMKADGLAFSPDGAALAASWHDAVRGREVLEFRRVSDGASMAAYDNLPWGEGNYGPVAYAPAGNRVVIGGNITMTIDLNTTARATLSVIRAPVFFTGLTSDGRGGGEILWTGGPGPYQVQVRRDLKSAWTDAGPPVTGNRAPAPAAGPETYYRVVAPGTF